MVPLIFISKYRKLIILERGKSDPFSTTPLNFGPLKGLFLPTKKGAIYKIKKVIPPLVK